jgi:hypothetical protein
MAFRITRIDLNPDEEIAAVHAVTDTVTLGLIQPMTELAEFGCSPDGADGMAVVTLTARGVSDVLRATGMVPEKNPLYPLTAVVNSKLFDVADALGGW